MTSCLTTLMTLSAVLKMRRALPPLSVCRLLRHAGGLMWSTIFTFLAGLAFLALQLSNAELASAVP